MTHLELCVQNVAEAWRNPGPYPVIHEKEKATLFNRWPTLFLAVKELVKAVEAEEMKSPKCHCGCRCPVRCSIHH